jgi:tryptophanyl-tRNA synthetase
MADSNEDIRRKVMKGVNDPEKHNKYHKANVKRDKKKAYDALNLPKSSRRRNDGDDVVDTGMFG